MQVSVLLRVYCAVLHFVRRENAIHTPTVCTGQTASTVWEMAHKTPGFSRGGRWMLTPHSQQFLTSEKLGRRKLSEGKLESGPLIIFSYFFPLLLTALDSRASEIQARAECRPKASSPWASGSTNAVRCHLICL